MSFFAVVEDSQIVDALNYAITNLGTGTATGNVLVANSTTGQITRADAPNDVIAYLYQYINVRYADSADGSTNFSTSPTNRLYFGLRNSQTSAASSNPADYIWTQVAGGGFGTTKFLYYITFGGRQIAFAAVTSAPSGGYVQTVDGVAIDLDVITSTTAQQIVTLPIYQRAASAPATPTGGTYNFNTLSLTPPTNWYSAVPAGTDPIWVSSNTFEASPSTPSVSPTGAWSTPALLAESATSTFTVVAYADSTSVPATPTGGTWNFSTGTGTPPTGNVTWALIPTTPTGNLYTSQTVASILGSSGTANLSGWSTPVEFGAAPGTDGLSVFYYSVFIASATQPATPGASGQYDFGTLVGTPPTGWSNFPPTPSPGQEIWVSSAQAAASTPTGIWTATGSSWSTPVQYNGTAGTNALIVVPNYDNGFIFTRNNANVWTPTPAANLITSTANVVATRGNTVAGYYNKIVSYNINTGVWTTTDGSTLNPGNFTFGVPQTTTSRYFNTVAYADTQGSSATNIQYAIVEGGVNGNAGPPGTRGFIPLAYIQTPSDPIAANTATLTSWFSALRTNGVPPIGISPDAGNIYTPVPGDTANFNDPTTNIQVTKTYDGTTWQNVAGEVINGNLIVVGSVTSNKLAANDIYALNIQSTGANIGNNASPGFWLQASTGNARFGGAVSIGSQLTVGSIINNSTLSSNSVSEAAVQTGAITNSKLGTGAVSNDKILATTITGNKIATGTITATNIQASTITGNEIAASTITGNKIAANTITATNILADTITGDKIAANTIAANSIQAGSITATQISSNYIYAGNIVSTGATLGDNNSAGYWLRYTDGSARFGGNVSIGNNLSVGNLITASALNANTISANNIQPGVITPVASGNITAFTNLSLTNSSQYDWTYTGGTNRGYVKTIARIAIPVSSALAALTSASPQYYRATFSCDITATGINAGITGPTFWVFTNYAASNPLYNYGGDNIPILIYANSTPVYPGADNTPGSLVSPQFGRYLVSSGSFPQSFTGPFQLSGTTQIPYSTGQALLNSTIIIGIALSNDNTTTPSGNVGSISMTNISFNVVPTSV